MCDFQRYMKCMNTVVYLVRFDIKNMAYLDSNFDGIDAVLMRNSWHYFVHITWRATFNMEWPHITPVCLWSHSQEPWGMEIGIVCTIGVPGLRSGGVSQEVDQELSKWVEPGRLEGKSPQVGSRGKANKLKQNVKIEYKFLRFPAKKIEFHKYRSRAWTVFLCVHNWKTNWRFNEGLNPHDLPSEYIRGFFLVQKTWDLGDNYGKMHIRLWRMPW